MRVHALLAQRRTLADAKPVLFVDDDQAQVLKGHVVLDERVRPDHDVRSACAYFSLERFLLPPGQRASQEPHLRGRIREQARERSKVLLGQDFGGRHDRNLLPVRE